MYLHLPSFRESFLSVLPPKIKCVYRNYEIFLFSAFPLREDWVKEAVAEALLKALRLGTPSPTQRRSLIRTPPGSHAGALFRTILRPPQGTEYLTSYRGKTRVTKYRYRIDLRVIEKILIDVRREEDARMILDLSDGFDFLSVRLVRESIRELHGYDFSFHRITDALNYLEDAGHVESNGHLKTHGREVKRVA